MFLMVIKLDIQTRRNNDINIYLCLLACYIEKYHKLQTLLGKCCSLRVKQLTFLKAFPIDSIAFDGISHNDFSFVFIKE